MELTQNQLARRAKDMQVFVDNMFKVYEDAEGLRDCTDDGHEKEIFNKTRNALYELKYRARELQRKWEKEAVNG